MRTILTSLVALLSWTALSQSTVTSVAPTVSSDAQVVGPPGQGVFAITEAGPHHRRWSKVSPVPMANGSLAVVTNSYVELASGLNRADETGRWVPASSAIELLNGAAVARQAQHQVIFSANLNDVAGTIDLLTPAGNRLRSRIAGLAYTDATGKSVFIAEVKDSQGLLVGDHQVIYEKAFDSVKADVRYTMTLSSFEQDVIWRQSLPDPADWGLQPDTTKVEVWTEFLEAPEPAKTSRTIRTSQDHSETDQLLEFGSFTTVLGKAYALGGEEPIGSYSHLPIAKEWQNIDGRRFLIESAEYSELQPLAKDLAEHQKDPRRITSTRLVAQSGIPAVRSLPLGHQARPAPSTFKTLQVAKTAPPADAGLVWDYMMINGTYTNFIFQGDTTYYVSGAVNLMSTTVLEGGAIIKATNYVSGSNYPGVYVLGPFSCLTSAYRKAIFTAKDDDSVGETIGGSTGVVTNGYYYALRALCLDGNGSGNQVQYVCFRYAASALNFVQGTGHEVRHCQLVNCYVGIEPDNCTLAIRNALITGSAFAALDSYSSTLIGEHATINSCTRIFNNNGSGSLALTNTLLVAFGSSDSYTSYSNATNLSGSGVFQSVGAGNYYLADGSVYRNAGTTNINTQLLADLGKSTTYPPITLTSDFTIPTVLAPQAQRDNDGFPDIGYHYHPLDYCISSLNLTNTTLVLTNGVAIGVYGTNGLILRNGASLVSEGTPLRLNRLTRYSSVQEQAINWGPTNSSMNLIDVLTPLTTLPAVSLRFTHIPMLAQPSFNAGYLLYTASSNKLSSFSMTDCQLQNGKLAFAPVWDSRSSCVSLTNNLAERGNYQFDQGPDGSPLSVNLRNNLFTGSFVALINNTNVGPWAVYQNLFDNCTYNVSLSGIPNGTNAYYITSYLPGSSGGDVRLTSAPDYQIGPLGRYYYPTNGGNLSSLINTGGRLAADAGLYHYTTTTDQVPEGSSWVDIGFHFIALDTNGNPVDSDSDGVPDYLEDRNGNNVVDTGETDRQNASDLGLRVLITEPKSNANVP
jgi:hypothetical protein